MPVDTQLPKTRRVLPSGTRQVTHTVEIVELRSNFLPTAGVPRSLRMDKAMSPRLNLTTGTLAVPPGLQAGLTYEVTSAVTPLVAETQLLNAPIAAVDRSKELELLQPPIRNLAADLTEGKQQGWQQMAAIRDKFVQEGFYDISEQAAPGHSYARIGSMLVDPTRIVGYGEQYAAAAAVMARVVSLPARVVVGYRIPDDRWANGRADVLAGDIEAWVELDAGALGWVPVDVTPDESRVPDPESSGVTIRDVAIPNPPPPPPPPPNVDPPQQDKEEIDDKEEEEEDQPTQGGGLPLWAKVTAAAVGFPFLVVVAAAAFVVALKRRRRNQRRRASPPVQIAGAWAEALDRLTEAGAPDHRGTPRTRQSAPTCVTSRRWRRWSRSSVNWPRWSTAPPMPPIHHRALTSIQRGPAAIVSCTSCGSRPRAAAA